MPAQTAAAAGSSSGAARARSSLLPYTLALLGANLLLHLVIVLGGNRITVLTTLPLVAIALGAALYLATRGRGLGRVRYGRFVAHALLYATVNVGYLLHAWVLVALGAPLFSGEPSAPDDAWPGAVLAMASFWGLGLILHGLGVVLDRGFEAPRP